MFTPQYFEPTEQDIVRAFNELVMPNGRPIYVFHFFDRLRPFGGITVAAYKENEWDTFCHVSTAVCSKKDTFVKKRGKDLAIADLLSGKSIKLPIRRNAKSRIDYLDAFKIVTLQSEYL